ncbi:MAG: hypothetical protein K6E91_00835 [Butyrivibrio sp.]|nr:hypothetical protein [Butyrivibrio sp.]
MFVLSTPNHSTGNLIRNLARTFSLPLSKDEDDMFVIRGEVPCYVDGLNRECYIFRMGDMEIAAIYPDGSIDVKATIPAIAKTLMSQSKNSELDISRTAFRTFI